MRVIFCSLLILVITLFAGEIRSEKVPKQVTLWTYYDFKPFLDDTFENGLIHDFAELLTSHSNEDYTFHVEYLPRKRIDLKLASNQLGMVALVNPQWFPEQYIASSPLLVGYDVIISPKVQPITVNKLQNISNASYIGVIGHQYPMIKKATYKENISRVDVSSMLSLFTLIEKQRADFSIVPGLVAKYFQSTNDFSHSVHFEVLSKEQYYRCLLMNDMHTFLKKHVDEIVEKTEFIQEWNTILKTYNIKELSAI